MQENVLKAGESHFLYPGTIFVEEGQCMITTILGSCVSVCLWDSALHAGGMNHYLLPLWNGDGLKTPKYGNVAIPLLIEKMLSMGCQRNHMKAKIFGGANVLEMTAGLLNVGERNIALAETALQDEKIFVISRDTGGTAGRKVLFMTETGDVFVRKTKDESKKS